jgi:hypothetical protein
MIKKITIDTAIDLEANEEAFSSQTMPLKGAYKLNKIFHEIADLTDASKQQFNNLITEYSEKDEEGNPVVLEDGSIKIQPDKIDECNEKISNLMNEEIEIDNYDLDIEQLGNEFNLNLEQMNKLSYILND